MPISTLDGCTEAHWSDVSEILTDAAESAGFEANLVSNADEVGIIQKRIVQNLYANHIVLCDVSGKNPNVMFELGMRLAFDKPVVIVKDDKTSYSFDTAPIEHLSYPRDLRFARIVEFKEKLAAKLSATFSASSQDSSYTTFLKHFGEFKVAKLDTREVSKDEYLIEELRMLRRSIARLEPRDRIQTGLSSLARPTYDVCVRCDKTPDFQSLIEKMPIMENVSAMSFAERSPGHFHISLDSNGPIDAASITAAITSVVAGAKVRVRLGRAGRWVNTTAEKGEPIVQVCD